MAHMPYNYNPCFFVDKRNRQHECPASQSGVRTSLGGASEGWARAHMGAGITRTQPQLTSPRNVPSIENRTHLVKGSIGDPNTNRPFGRWHNYNPCWTCSFFNKYKDV